MAVTNRLPPDTNICKCDSCGDPIRETTQEQKYVIIDISAIIICPDCWVRYQELQKDIIKLK